MQLKKHTQLNNPYWIQYFIKSNTNISDTSTYNFCNGKIQKLSSPQNVIDCNIMCYNGNGDDDYDYSWFNHIVTIIRYKKITNRYDFVFV